MSQARHFPIYVARFPNNEGCGHQHSQQYRAWNCAGHVALRRKGIAWVEVVKISHAGRRERILGHAENTGEKCTECGSLILRPDTEHEWGHDDDCPLIGD